MGATAGPDPSYPADPHLSPVGRNEIDDLFARIRADRERAVAEAKAQLAWTDEPEPEAAGRLATAAPAPASGSGARGDEARVQRRNDAIEPIGGQLARRLKRALQDEQNAALDRLRTARTVTRVDELLPPGARQVTPYEQVAAELLEQAAHAGAAAAPFGAVGVGVADLARELAQELAGSLRGRLDRVLAESAREGLDLAGMSERISAVYREWKTQRVEQLAIHYLVAAHERGAFVATPEGTSLRWVVDDDVACPDCDDNALAGATPRGTPFPTGQLHPPAHIGCRCLLAPASA